MKGERSTVAMFEAALIAVVVTVLIIGMGYLPLTGYFILMLPSVFSVVWIRRGLRYGVLSVLVSSLLCFFFGFVTESLFVLLNGGLICGLMSEGVLKEKKTSVVLALGSLGAFISTAILLYVAQKLAGIQWEALFLEATKQTKAIFETMGVDPKTAVDFNEQFDRMLYFLKNLIPFIFLSSAFFVGLLNLWAMRLILPRVGYKNMLQGRFQDFTLPKSTNSGMFIMFVLSFLLGVMGWAHSRAIAMNVYAIIIFVYSVQGLAVALFLMERRKIRRMFKIILIATVILFYSLLYPPIFVLGLVEAGWGLRARIEKKS